MKRPGRINYNEREIITGVINFVKSTEQPNLLPDVVAQLGKIYHDPQLANHGVVYSPLELDTTTMSKISSKISDLFSRKIPLKQIKDKSLIVGFKIKIGDWIYDASVKGQLDEFIKAYYAKI